MAGDHRASRRYARALFNAALKGGEVDEVAASLDAIAQAAGATPQFMNVMRHPLITRERKKEMLHHIFEGRVQPVVEHFLFLLIENDRAAILPDIGEQYKRFLDEHKREMDAEVVSAVPLTPAQTEALKTRLQAESGYKVRLEARVDESLLGGLMVRVGDRLFDGSIVSQLRRIEEQLQQVKVS
jgi:F-type H+-transporting ATPase subunit delta